MRSTPGAVDTTNIVLVCTAEGRINEPLLREMLGYFVNENRRRMALAADALAAGNRQSLREIAHAIRGSAALLGAGRLHQLAGALEQDAAAGEADALSASVVAMNVEFVAVHAALRAQHPAVVSE